MHRVNFVNIWISPTFYWNGLLFIIDASCKCIPCIHIGGCVPFEGLKCQIQFDEKGLYTIGNWIVSKFMFGSKLYNNMQPIVFISRFISVFIRLWLTSYGKTIWLLRCLLVLNLKIACFVFVSSRMSTVEPIGEPLQLDTRPIGFFEYP